MGHSRHRFYTVWPFKGNYFTILLNSCHGAKRLPGNVSQCVYQPVCAWHDHKGLVVVVVMGGRQDCPTVPTSFSFIFTWRAAGVEGEQGVIVAPSQRLSEGDAHSAVLPKRHCCKKNSTSCLPRLTRTREPGPLVLRPGHTATTTFVLGTVLNRANVCFIFSRAAMSVSYFQPPHTTTTTLFAV